MAKRRVAVIVLFMALLAPRGAPGQRVPEGRMTGTVVDRYGDPLPGVMVTVRGPNRGIDVTTTTDVEGRYRVPGLRPGAYDVEAHRLGYESVSRRHAVLAGTATVAGFTLAPVEAVPADRASSAMLLGLLADGEIKRRFILDCTGCHAFDARTISADGRLRTREEWAGSVRAMLAMAGPETDFPIISVDRDPERTADWLAAQLGSADSLPRFDPPPAALEGRRDALVTEYALPDPDELPHDLRITPDGSVAITGMLTGRMYELDPGNGEFSEIPIPVPNANPRALDFDDQGRWWVLLGVPRQVARYDPDSLRWSTYSIDAYPHSLAIDTARRVWFNGHFTADPARIGYVDATTGAVRTFEVPATGMRGSPIPYGLRVAPDGSVWGTELLGNRLIRLVPETETFQVHTLPEPHSGPRRLDIAPDGTVWAPEYAANKLARFDPGTETFTEYDFPISDALPYVVRVDQRRGTVWIGTAAADALASFDPESERFSVYPLPTRGALIRHIDIDPVTGDVWAAYGPFPPQGAKVARLRLP